MKPTIKSVGVYEAKTHLPSLLAKVQKGDSFEITRHGVPLARLVPIAAAADTSTLADALAAWKTTRKNIRLNAVIDQIKKIRKGVRLNGLTIQQLRDEGRR